MSTELLLSTATTGLRMKKAFQLARELKIPGVEVFPFRWTTVCSVEALSHQSGVEVRGIHYPFWWDTVSHADVVKAESTKKERLLASWIYPLIIGSGHVDCSAARIAAEFPSAYHLVHADVLMQMPFSLRVDLFTQRDVYIENQRPKNGANVRTVYDPEAIQQSFFMRLPFYHGHLMFDPRHVQIAQQQGLLEKRSMADLYTALQPGGLHFSFLRDNPTKSSLPWDSTWVDFRDALKQYSPKYVVIETTTGRRDVERARDMIGKVLNI